jgi:signal transduction histidine kinase
MPDYLYDIVLVIVLGTVIFLTLVFFIAIFIVQQKRKMNFFANERKLMEAKYNQELLQAKLETQESSFHQISEELHDNIGQLLSSVRLMLSVYFKSVDQKPQTLVVADETLDKAISDLRNLSKSLNPEWLHQFSLLKNVQSEVDRLNAAGGIEVHFKPLLESLPLSPDAQLMLFRIVQEALQNSIKHSGARHIYIDLEEQESRLQVSIADDGVGISPYQQKTPGVGLLSMKHRISLLGGTISWQRQEPQGTEVFICLPIQNGA